jgi:hypothetical protein
VVAVTGLDVAFISAVAAAAAAVAAPISAWFIAMAHNRHDRWVKTFDNLRTAYSGLLQGYIAARSMVLRLAHACERNDPSIYVAHPEEDEAVRVERLASVNVLASHRVGDALAEWEAAWRTKVTPVLENLQVETSEDRLASAMKLRASLEAVEVPWRRLHDAIRSDLRSQ